MARIDSIQLIRLATDIAPRANEVRSDPAVQKAWREAGRDIARAVQSVREACVETHAAWRRTDPGNGDPLLA